jgi:hypothetical protein
MASVAELLAAASGESQSESEDNPVQRNDADFVPETEDDDPDVAAVPVVVEPAKKKKQANIQREWEDILSISQAIDSGTEIKENFERIADQEMQRAGGDIMTLFRKKEDGAGMFSLAYKKTNASGNVVSTFRCPCKHSFGCDIMLRTIDTRDKVILQRSGVHDADSHSPAHDCSKKLKVEQKLAVSKAIIVDPLVTSTKVARHVAPDGIESVTRETRTLFVAQSSPRGPRLLAPCVEA